MIEIWWEHGQWSLRLVDTHGHQRLVHASQALEWAYQRMDDTNFNAYMTVSRHLFIVPVNKTWTPLIENASRNDVYKELLVYLQMLETP